jgi:hypothetical protein
LGVQVGVLGEMDSDDSGDLFLVFIVLLQEVLDVFVLGQRELGEREDRGVELQGVKLDLCLLQRLALPLSSGLLTLTTTSLLLSHYLGLFRSALCVLRSLFRPPCLLIQFIFVRRDILILSLLILLISLGIAGCHLLAIRFLTRLRSFLLLNYSLLFLFR